jgi:hypothetical protein
VLIFLFTAPLFTITNYMVAPNSFMYGLDAVKLVGARTKIG